MLFELSDFRPDLSDWIALAAVCVSIIAARISFITAARARALGALQTYMNNRSDSESLLIEIDKQLISEPRLWSLYDGHPLASSTEMTPEMQARLQAFTYMMINMFFLSLDYYEHHDPQTAAAANSRKAWESYLEEVMHGSSRFRAIAINKRTHLLYTTSFVRTLRAAHERWFSTAIEAREMTDSNFDEAVRVGKLCFPLMGDHEGLCATFRNYTHGTRQYHSEYLSEDVLLHCCWVYEHRKSERIVGIGGLFYRGSDMTSLWMNWFGVDPSFIADVANGPRPRTSISSAMLSHEIAEARRVGGRHLRVYTADSRSNMLAHAFYERHGFRNEGTFERHGECERTYVLSLWE